MKFAEKKIALSKTSDPMGGIGEQTNTFFIGQNGVKILFGYEVFLL